MYAPLNSIQQGKEVSNNKRNTSDHNVNNEISPNRQQEEQLASPLPVEGTGKPLPQRMRSKRGEIPPENKEFRDPRSKPPVHSGRINNTRRQINYDSWGENDTSYLQMPYIRQQTVLEQFSINDTTDIRLCYRCGGEGHIKKFCNMNVHCDFCKSYSHHTSVCRSYVNFVKAHPVASSRRTSPAQVNKQLEWPCNQVEESLKMAPIHTSDHTNNRHETSRKREISDITRKHLEQVISVMIPSSTGSSIDPIESVPANSLATQPGYEETEGMMHKSKEIEKPTVIYNYYISDKEAGWKQLRNGEIPPSELMRDTQKTFSEISPNKTQNENQWDKKEQVKQDAIHYHLEEGEKQNMSPPSTVNLNYPPPARYAGNLETSTMLDCIHQLQLTLQQHVMTNSKQTEYHMSQNADLFAEMIQVQKRRDLDPAVMAIPTFTGQEPEKCLDWINRIKNICSQAGRPLRQELMNKSEPVVQNFIQTMGEDWTDEEVVEEILKYFSDIPTPAHAITKLRALIQGGEEVIVTYNQKYRTLVERVEGKPVEKIDSYVKLEQYLGSVILPIRKSIRNNIYWKSKHAPKTLGEAMRKAEELYMKHIYATGGVENKNENTAPTEVVINEVMTQKTGQYSQRAWRNKEGGEISPNSGNFQRQSWKTRENSEISANAEGFQRQLPRGSYTQIMVNPTQLSDREFAAWMDRLVEARRNRQENKPRPFRQFRKPFIQRKNNAEETQWQEGLKNKLKPAEELNTEEIMAHMRCEYADIEEAVEMYNLDVEECRSA